MLSLKEIQDAFTQHVLADDQRIVEHVIGTKKASSELRLGIYDNAYRERGMLSGRLPTQLSPMPTPSPSIRTKLMWTSSGCGESIGR